MEFGAHDRKLRFKIRRPLRDTARTQNFSHKARTLQKSVFRIPYYLKLIRLASRHTNKCWTKEIKNNAPSRTLAASSQFPLHSH